MTHRILLADDSVTIRKVVELTFSDEDFTIDSVGDGSQALERARVERPDIVISDVIMPGLNGYELCQQLKSDPALQSVPFLFLKGTFESFDEQRARACGADGFIVKPFESQEMIARVKEMIAAGPSATRAPAASMPVAAAPTPVPAAPPAAALVPPPAAAPSVPVAPQRAATPSAAAPLPAPPPPPRPAPFRPPTMPPVIPAAARAPMAAQPPAPPAVPPTPQRPVAPPPIPAWPAPPQPPRPERPFAPPPEPEPFSIPPAPPEPPAPQRPPAPIEEFGFDFGEAETFGAAGAAPFAAPAASVPEQPEQAGETDEDLWSEVSLRDRGADILEAPGAAPPPPEWSDAGAIGPQKGPAEDETTFAQTTAGTASLEPAPVVEEFEDFVPPAAPVALRREEIPEAPTSQLQEPDVARAGASIDPEALEQLVAAQVQAAVRRVLDPLVNDLARGMVEAIAWEVIPELAEAMIRAEIERIRQSTRTD